MTDNERKEEARNLLEGKPKEEAEAKQEEINDPMVMLRKLCRGNFKLLSPIRAHGQDVKELAFDFCSLTSEEVMDALDSAPNFNNLFAISNKQAMALFAATCAKNAPITDEGGMKTRLYDAKDILTRMGGADAVKAVQLAKLFYNASSQAGNNSISRE